MKLLCRVTLFVLFWSASFAQEQIHEGVVTAVTNNTVTVNNRTFRIPNNFQERHVAKCAENVERQFLPRERVAIAFESKTLTIIASCSAGRLESGPWEEDAKWAVLQREILRQLRTMLIQKRKAKVLNESATHPAANSEYAKLLKELAKTESITAQKMSEQKRIIADYKMKHLQQVK